MSPQLRSVAILERIPMKWNRCKWQPDEPPGRYRAVLSRVHMLAGGDWTGWLGRNVAGFPTRRT
jgi:hypothetical protein